eukprot:comp20689_c0_seq1/m.26934 comp20689_c0_seq1/g.26934  ORF comp20689_c0_seq1/g.26934 comp20689_c0_seq1/m.26934 type:complete len:1185 (-) comp20689_c0_seq1:634-4188(-)
MDEGRSTPVRPLPSWLRTAKINSAPRSGGKVSDRVHQRMESTPLGPSTLLTNSPSSTEVTPHQTPQGYKGTLSRVFEFATPTVTPRRPARCEKKTRLLRAAVNECMRGSRLARNGISPYKKLGLDLSDFADLLAGCTLLDSANKENFPTPGKGNQPIEVLMVTEIGNWLLDKSVWQEEELSRLKDELESEQQLTASLEDTVSQLRSGIRARDVLEDELSKGERTRAQLEHQVAELTHQLREAKEVTAYLTERERALETDLVAQVKAAEASRAEARQRERELTEQILRLEDELSNEGTPNTPLKSGWELELPESTGSLCGLDEIAAMAARNRALEDLVVALQDEVDQLKEALEQSQLDHADMVLALKAELSDAQAATTPNMVDGSMSLAAELSGVDWSRHTGTPTSTTTSPTIMQGETSSFPEDPAIPQTPTPHPTTTVSAQTDTPPRATTTKVGASQPISIGFETPNKENAIVCASTPTSHTPVSNHFDDPRSEISTTHTAESDLESVENYTNVEAFMEMGLPLKDHLSEQDEQSSPMRSDNEADSEGGREEISAGFMASLEEAAIASSPPSPMPQVRSYGHSAGAPLLFENYAMCVPLPPSPSFSQHYTNTPLSPLGADNPSSPIGYLDTSPFPVLANQNRVAIGDCFGEIRLADESLLDLSPIPHRRISHHAINPPLYSDDETDCLRNQNIPSPTRQQDTVGDLGPIYSEPLGPNVDSTPPRAGTPDVVRSDFVTATQSDYSFSVNEPSVIVETMAIPTMAVFISGPEDHSRTRKAAVCANTNTSSAEKRGTALLSAAVALAYATESAATFVDATMHSLPPSPARSEGYDIQSDCTTPGQAERVGQSNTGTPKMVIGADQYECTTPLRPEVSEAVRGESKATPEESMATLSPDEASPTYQAITSSKQSTVLDTPLNPSTINTGFVHRVEGMDPDIITTGVTESEIPPFQLPNTPPPFSSEAHTTSGESVSDQSQISPIDTCKDTPIISLQHTNQTQSSDTPTMVGSHVEQSGDFCSEPAVGEHVTEQEHVAGYLDQSTMVDDSQWGPSILDHSTLGNATMLELQSEVLAHVYLGDHAKLLMKGAWFQKRTRWGRHERFFVVNPMTRIVYWRKRATVGLGSRWAKIAHVNGFSAEVNSRKGRYTFRFDTGGDELLLTTTDHTQYQAWKQALEETIGSTEPLAL